MKNKIILWMALFAAIPFCIFSQKAHQSDAYIRSSYASYYLEEVQEANYTFDTPLGQATANIILKAYRDLLPAPDISAIQINGSDRTKVEHLVIKLQQLRESPPSWNELFKLEEKRLIEWDKAMHRKSIYKSVGN